MNRINDNILHLIKAKNEITNVPKNSAFDAAAETDTETTDNDITSGDALRDVFRYDFDDGSDPSLR